MHLSAPSPQVLVIGFILICTGCATYQTPGGPASFRALGITEQEIGDITDYSITRRLERKPTASFPTALAVVRVQDRGYYSRSSRGSGSGNYTVVTNRDVETDDDFNQIAALPMLRGLAPLNPLVMPGNLNTDLELRQGAASVQADMLFIYTFDTDFSVEHTIAPLGVITLGLFPEADARVTSTAYGALLDTRTGYVYGLIEGTGRDTQLANAWTSNAAIDQVRRRVEREAFEKLVASFETIWPGIVETYGPQIATPDS